MKNDSYYMDMYFELRDDYNHLKSEKIELMSQLEKLRASSFTTAVPVEEYERLKAEVERLKEDKQQLEARLDFLENPRS